MSFTISDEAVEAAARALYETQIGSRPRPWDGRGRVYKESWRQDVRTVLDAWLEAEGFEVERWDHGTSMRVRVPNGNKGAHTRLVGKWTAQAPANAS